MYLGGQRKFVEERSFTREGNYLVIELCETIHNRQLCYIKISYIRLYNCNLRYVTRQPNSLDINIINVKLNQSYLHYVTSIYVIHLRSGLRFFCRGDFESKSQEN